MWRSSLLAGVREVQRAWCRWVERGVMVVRGLGTQGAGAGRRKRYGRHREAGVGPQAL